VHCDRVDRMTMSLDRLYPHFYYVLKDYLTSKEYSLLTATSKQYFDEVRRDTLHYYVYDHYCPPSEYEDFGPTFGSRFSNEFFENEVCRSRLLSKINDPSKQLHISVTSHNLKLFLSLKIKVHTFDLRLIEEDPDSEDDDYTEEGNLERIQENQLDASSFFQSFCGSSALSLPQCDDDLFSHNPLTFSSLTELKLSRWSKLISFPPSYLSKQLHTVEISYCISLVDVSSFSHVHTLMLSDCPNVVDVSQLGKIRHLCLSSCSGITDVSALGKVYDLHLYHCNGILDISCLKHNRKVSMDDNRSIQDYSSLKNCFSLSFASWYDMTIFSSFYSLKYLSISYLRIKGNQKIDLKPLSFLTNLKCITAAGSFSNLSSLSHIPYVNLIFWSNSPNFGIETEEPVEEVNLLSRRTEVERSPSQDSDKENSIVYNIPREVIGIRSPFTTKVSSSHPPSPPGIQWKCKKVSLRCHYYNYGEILDFSPLATVNELSILYCNSFTNKNAYQIASVPIITIDSCNTLTDVSMFRNCSKLRLVFCEGIQNVQDLGNVEDLSIENCINISSLKGLGESSNQKKISLSNSSRLMDADEVLLRNGNYTMETFSKESVYLRKRD
jgi:hypothetical protein